MTKTNAPETVTATSETMTRMNQESMSRMNRQCLCYTRGVMNIAVQQIEWAGGLIETGMESMALLGRARTPDEWLRGEVELFRKQSEQTLAAAARIGGIVQHMMVEASARPDGVPNGVPNGVTA